VALRRAHPLLRHGTPTVIGTAPLTLLITAIGTDGGPDAALLLALNPADAPADVALPAEHLDAWVRHLDTADPDLLLEGVPLPEGVGAFTLRERSVVLLGSPRPPAASPGRAAGRGRRAPAG
jgi:hypothetical protein